MKTIISRTLIIRLSSWFAIAFLVILLPLFTPATAKADQSWPYDKRYFSGSGYLYVHYANNCSPSDFEAAVDDSTWAWTDTPTLLDFRKVSTNCQPMDTDVDYFTGYWTDYNARAITWNYTWQCYSVDGYVHCGYYDIDSWLPYSTINASVIRMNTYNNSFRDLGWFGMRNALTHETGHTLGLDHVPCNEALSIMNTGGCNSNIDTPTTKDINDINSMYHW